MKILNNQKLSTFTSTPLLWINNEQIWLLCWRKVESYLNDTNLLKKVDYTLGNTRKKCKWCLSCVNTCGFSNWNYQKMLIQKFHKKMVSHQWVIICGFSNSNSEKMLIHRLKKKWFLPSVCSQLNSYTYYL